MKAVYDKHKTNIILNSENLKTFPVKSRTRQRCPLSPLLFNIVLEVLPTAIRQKKKKRASKLEGNYMSLYADYMVLYIENPKDSTQNPLLLINKFSKIAG